MCRLLLALVAAVALPEASRAAEPEPPAVEPESAAVEPPRPLELPPAEYPVAALAEGQSATVVLDLLIDETGAVTEATVVEPAGPAFDEAARRAALRYRFEPARQGGAPVPVRIHFEVKFAAPVMITPAPPGEANVFGPAPAPASPPPAAPGFESVVEGDQDRALLESSAEAVRVVDTRRAAKQSADLGEVLARTEGVGVRRRGGLGSDTRFSLNGLTDEQIRFFLDGVPLELSGFALGISNVPVGFVRRVEIYRGVVPVRFGSDALGGAVNIVTEAPTLGSGGGISYQLGSYGTHRLTLGGHEASEETGLYLRANAFLDAAENDYPVDVEVFDHLGRLSDATVNRFHDGYRAVGGGIEGGIRGRRWADHLRLRLFAADAAKEIQNNAVMTVPYGEVRSGETSYGGTLGYGVHLGGGLRLDALLGYGYQVEDFIDESRFVYSWYGQKLNERSRPGEVEGTPHDRSEWQHGIYARLVLAQTLPWGQEVRAVVAPTYVTRTGKERDLRSKESLDPLRTERTLSTLVAGVEHQVDLLSDRVENIVFGKVYRYETHSARPEINDQLIRSEATLTEPGYGDALRVTIVEGLSAKASYEHAIRLPRPNEIFGDAGLTMSNLELLPERSDNLNLGLALLVPATPVGEIRAQATGFGRFADDLILVLGNDVALSYQNVFAATSVGVEGELGWTSPGGFLALDGNLTWQDFRNVSKEGVFKFYDGDRIPNRPWFFANGSARLQWRGVTQPDDELALDWNTRYVHEFFRSWESAGIRSTKQKIPSQLLHEVALTWSAKGNGRELTTSVSIDNVTDADAFDFFGLQRPGRAFYAKVTLAL